MHLALAILSCGLQVFLIQHLWRYDRFKCLAWSSGRQPGAFKRIMTYSYLTSVPALVAYSVSMAVLKYRNGYAFIPGHGIVPTPYQLWPSSDQAWLRPLYILFAVTWGLELVTHLEELMFWLFLIHQGPERRDWFASIEFRSWAIGSCIAMAGLPVTAVLTRADPLRAEAYIFLVGGAASTVVTLFFFIVLAKFPSFLRQVKQEGAAGQVVLRLVKFHELNILRVIFRIFMTIPLLLLGIDGVMEKHVLNNSALWSDVLAFFAAVGLVTSSTLTLLIFFPRSLAEDSNWRPKTSEPSSESLISSTTDQRRPTQKPPLTTRLNQRNRYPDPGSPTSYISEGGQFHTQLQQNSPSSGAPILSKSKIRYYNANVPPDFVAEGESQYEMQQMDHSIDSKVRLWESKVDLELGEGALGYAKMDETGGHHINKDSKIRMMELGRVIDAGMRKPPRPPRLHPYITSFHSPIDLMYRTDAEGPRAI